MTGEFCSNCGYSKNGVFLFGPVYYLYRKIWLEAILLWIANGIINFMFSRSFVTALLSFTLLIFSAILFSKLYTKKAN